MRPVPGEKGRFLLGFLPEFRRAPADFLLRMARRFGPVASFRLGPQQTYLINHPDYIREVLQTQSAKVVKSRSTERIKVVLGEGLLTSENPLHHRQRRLSQPAFYRNRLEGYATAMVEEAETLAHSLQPDQTLELDRAMMALTLNVVTRTLFSSAAGVDATEVGDAVNDLLQMFPLLVVPFSEHLHKFPVLPASRRMLSARDRLDRIVYGLIRARRASGEQREDLLGMLLAARDEDDGSGMSDKQVRDEVLTIFLAGHETTAVALTWTWWLLAQHPEVEAQVHREVDEVLGTRPAAFADYEKLSYCEQVVAEAMRLYPPAWAMGRRAIAPVEFDGFVFPSGSVFIVSPYVLHRTEEFWPQPERFQPERFSVGVREARPKLAYLPFGFGPRICIGERFAWMEAVLLLATLAQHWRFRPAPGQTMTPDPLITLRPKERLRVVAEPRTATRLY